MLKIEFYKPQLIQVNEKRIKKKGEVVITPLFDFRNEVFARSIIHTKRVIHIEMINGYLHTINVSDGNKIDRITPFNENQTKQYKL